MSNTGKERKQSLAVLKRGWTKVKKPKLALIYRYWTEQVPEPGWQRSDYVNHFAKQGWSAEDFERDHQKALLEEEKRTETPSSNTRSNRGRKRRRVGDGNSNEVKRSIEFKGSPESESSSPEPPENKEGDGKQPPSNTQEDQAKSLAALRQQVLDMSKQLKLLSGETDIVEELLDVYPKRIKDIVSMSNERRLKMIKEVPKYADVFPIKRSRHEKQDRFDMMKFFFFFFYMNGFLLST